MYETAGQILTYDRQVGQYILFFFFEFQGYVAAMIKAHGLTMGEVFVKILELMELFENVQKGKTRHEQNHDQ